MREEHAAGSGKVSRVGRVPPASVGNAGAAEGGTLRATGPAEVPAGAVVDPGR